MLQNQLCESQALAVLLFPISCQFHLLTILYPWYGVRHHGENLMVQYKSWRVRS